MTGFAAPGAVSALTLEAVGGLVAIGPTESCSGVRPIQTIKLPARAVQQP